MNEETSLNLLVTPLIETQDTCMRQAISPHSNARLLATGRTYEDLQFTDVISSQALSKII
jgi:hypothetical protein